MAKEEATIADIVAFIAAVKARINKRTEKAIGEIIALAYRYPVRNKRFTFDKDADLDAQVNTILVELTDIIINDIVEYSYQVKALVDDDADDDAIFAWITRLIDGETMTQRLDKHGTKLKSTLEAFLAVGFANHITQSEINAIFLANETAPLAWGLLKSAYRDSAYEAEIIRARGYTYGKDLIRNPNEAIGLVATQALIEAFNYTEQRLFEKNGAIGWTTRRGSTYDCALCDDMVGVVHPMSEIFCGWHPRCMCIMEPVFAE